MAPPTISEPDSSSTASRVPAEAAAEAAARPKPLMRGWLHLGAFVATCIAGPILVSDAPTTGATVALVVYVISIALLFGVSAAFHLKHWSPVARRRMRRADHSMIFVAIAGSYTAVAGLALTGWARVAILVIAWVGAVVGITLRQVWLNAPKWAIALPYVVVGWCALLVAPQLVHSLGGAGFALLLAGGAAYTVGAVVYARKRPDPWPTVFGYHEVFHLCTIIGAGLHFYVIAHYALPLA